MYHIEIKQRTAPDDISVLMQRKQAILLQLYQFKFTTFMILVLVSEMGLFLHR